jgi:hypothetical protein
MAMGGIMPIGASRQMFHLGEKPVMSMFHFVDEITDSGPLVSTIMRLEDVAPQVQAALIEEWVLDVEQQVSVNCWTRQVNEWQPDYFKHSRVSPGKLQTSYTKIVNGLWSWPEFVEALCIYCI